MREIKDIQVIPEGSLDGIESDFGILYIMSRSLEKKLRSEVVSTTKDAELYPKIFEKIRSQRFPGFLTVTEASQTVASGLFLLHKGNVVFNTHPFVKLEKLGVQRMDPTEFSIAEFSLIAAEDYEGLRTGASEIFEGKDPGVIDPRSTDLGSKDLLGWEIRLSRTASTLNSIVKASKEGRDLSDFIFETLKEASAVDSWYWINKGILNTKVKGVMGHGVAIDVYDPEYPEKGGIKHHEVAISPELAKLHNYKNGQKIRAKRFPLNYITSSGIFTIRIVEGLGYSLGFTAKVITELFEGDCDGDLYFLFQTEDLESTEDEIERFLRPSWRDRKLFREVPRLHLGLAHYGDPTPSDALVERKLRLHVGMITNLGRDTRRVYLIKSRLDKTFNKEVLGNIWNFFGKMVDKALDSRKGITELFPIDNLIGYFRGTANCVLPEKELIDLEIPEGMIEAVKSIRNSCQLSGDKLPSVRAEVSRSQVFRVLVTLKNQMGTKALPLQGLFQALKHKGVVDVPKAMIEDLLTKDMEDFEDD